MKDLRGRPVRVRAADWKLFDVAMTWGHDIGDVNVAEDETFSGTCNYCGLIIREDEEPTNCVMKLARLVHED